MWWNACGYGYSWFGFVFFFVVLLWVFSRNQWRRWERRDRWSNAEDILSEKFAKGEITEKEYKTKMDIIHQHMS